MSTQCLLGVFLTLLAGLSAAAEVEQVHIHHDGHRLPAYRARAAGRGPFPAVLFLHGGRGGAVGGDPKASVAALARAGYIGLAPIRLKPNTLKTEISQTHSALAYLRNLRQVDPQRVAVVGFSRGALDRALRLATVQMPPVLILVAENDTRQADHVELAQKTRQQLQQSGVAAEWILYSPFGAPTADGHRLFFAVRSNYFKDIVAFLSQHLGHSQAE